MYYQMKRRTCCILLNQATECFVVLYKFFTTFLRYGKKEKMHGLVKKPALRVTVTAP